MHHRCVSAARLPPRDERRSCKFTALQIGPPASPALLAAPAAAQTRRSGEDGRGNDQPGGTTGHRSGACSGWPAGRTTTAASAWGPQRGNAAICGLCGMAFMSGGSTPGRGPYGHRVEQAVDYLLANAQPSGFIVEPTPTTHGPMYSHGFATLFLAECYGMSKRTELRDKLGLAVKLIVNSQNKEGGWRYYPKKDDADISVTVCQVMALRAAHNAGIHVPKETIDRGRQVRDELPEPRRRFRLHAQRRRRKLVSPLGGRDRRPEQCRHLHRSEPRAGNHQRARLSDPVPPGARRHAARAVLRIRPLLRRAGHVAGRRRALGPLVSGHPRRVDRPAGARRFLDLGLRIRICHGHVPHHLADAREPVADLPAVRRHSQHAERHYDWIH